MTRRFDIGPIVLALGAIALLIALFLDWFAAWNAWEVFEITDVLLAALAIAGFVAALGLLVPDVDFVDRRFMPWIVGAALILVLNQLLAPGVALEEADFGTGAWTALAARAGDGDRRRAEPQPRVLQRRHGGPRPAPARVRGRPPAAADGDRRPRRALQHLAAAPAAG